VGEERRRMTSDGGHDAAQLTKTGHYTQIPLVRGSMSAIAMLVRRGKPA
jgi:hypothetical protein